ncbi:hypothetical protein M2337_002393 [Sphingobium sp. B2D3A]|nr:hypothetical protein [Sphingobium sp. B2D3A]
MTEQAELMRPVLAAWGMRVDSTAMIIEWVARGLPLSVVLRADTGTEREETYDCLPVFQRWMDGRHIEHHVVRYIPKRFKHWPPYYSLLENCLTNATLPSISFRRHSCSQKWKIQPQDQWVANWEPAKAAWARGQKVIKLIGYDSSPADSRRYAHREGHVSDLYDYHYPLREWGWDRDACILRIKAEGLPVPIKSACWICAAQKVHELAGLLPWCLRLIVLVEARAAPLLRTVEGLWRSTSGSRPGSMTRYIREHSLLPRHEIYVISSEAPCDLIDFQRAAADVPVDERPRLREWIDHFNEGALRLAA